MSVSSAPLADDRTIRRVILAASLGTLFEWYDFYLYGSLAVFFGRLFFPSNNETAQLLSSLATFGAGFAVRPLGALVFGHVGDRVGRKYTFLVTMSAMGLGTSFIGLLPTYEKWGIVATCALVLLRLLQGLALGGEYGGAATYLAEHVPDAKRGYFTSYLQSTATLGFLMSMGAIALTRVWAGEVAFRAWGWRIPFLLSFPILAISLYIRARMRESPIFEKLKRSDALSVHPLRETLTSWPNLKYMILALFGACAGQAVIGYTSQFYALTFLQATLKMDWKTSYSIVSMAVVITSPLFIFFGWLSDRIGRKAVMLSACALAAITYLPIYRGLKYFSSPFQFWPMVMICSIQIMYVCMAYGPMAAFLVEMFPTRIRCTSLALPYHIANGWIGGFLPLVATALSASAWARANFGADAIFVGLIYPICICVTTVVVGFFFIRETRTHALAGEAIS